MAESAGKGREGRIRVLLVDDHEVLLDGLAALVGAEPDMEAVACAVAREDAVHKARECLPDVAIVDLFIPGGGLNLIEDLRAISPATRVLVLTLLDDAQHVRAVASRGASGYLVKYAAAREVLDATRAVARGETYFPRLPVSAAQVSEDASALAAVNLSSRETQVLRFLARGLTHKEIAARLDVSKKSVDTYRRRLQQKLGASGRADLVRYAISLGHFGDPVDA